MMPEDSTMREDSTRRTNMGECGCCRISRRCFLATSAAAALAAPLAGCHWTPASHRRAAADGDLGETIDLASLRPRPRTRVTSVVVRQKPPYWLGWPGTAYDVEGRRKEYERTFGEAAQRVGVRLRAERDPLESDDAVNAFVGRLKSAKPDAALVSLQHFGAWRWADVIARQNVPTIIFAPIGVAFTGHVLEISRRPGVHVVSSLDTGAVEQALRMVRAKRQLEETRLLVVSGGERRDAELERLGTKVRTVPRSSLHELFARMPVTDETREVARKMRRGASRPAKTCSTPRGLS